MDEHNPAEKNYDLERLIFFTDGVFAIVITLLVIELHPPEGWDRTLTGLLRAEGRSLLAYAASFAAVGVFWNSHRLIFRQIVRFHPGLVVMNMLLMSFVVLLPFALELMFKSEPRGQPILIYMGLLATISLCQALLFGFAAFIAKVVDPRLSTRSSLLRLASMLLGPVLIVAVAAAMAKGLSPRTMVWIVPLIAVAAAVRRLVARQTRRDIGPAT